MKLTNQFSIAAKAIFMLAVALLVSIASPAQGSTLLRGEISADENDYCYFIPVSKKGLMVVSHSEKSSKNNDSWSIQLYSKNLTAVYGRIISTPNNNFLLEYLNQGDSILYLFFAQDGGAKSFTIYRWNIENGSHLIFNHGTPEQSMVTNINIHGNNMVYSTLTNPTSLQYLGQALFTLTTIPIFFGTSIYSQKPKLIYYNTSARISGETTLMDDGISQILASFPDTSNNSMITIIKNKKNRHIKYFVNNFNLITHESINTDITSLVENNLLNVKLIHDGKGGLIMIGDYNNSTGINKNLNSSSIGLFVGRLMGGKIEYLKYYPFTKFNNAAFALTQQQQIKLKKNIKEQSYNLSFRLLWHDRIINQDSSFVVVAETFHPEYHNETNFDTRGLMYNNEVFDGYRFTNAITAAFDQNGNLLWDNYMRIEDIISYELSPNVEIYFDNNEQVMLYYSKEKIHSKVIRGNEIVYKDDAAEVATVNKSEKVVYENYNKIYYWYDEYFLLTGYQAIYNQKADKRNVFYFLKISFE